MKDAARQVEAAQRNILADYGELYQLRRENKILSDTNENLESELNALLGQFGGGNSDSDLRWDGRRPDEEEEAYRWRCLMFAIGIVKRQHEKNGYIR